MASMSFVFYMGFMSSMCALCIVVQNFLNKSLQNEKLNVEQYVLYDTSRYILHNFGQLI